MREKSPLKSILLVDEFALLKHNLFVYGKERERERERSENKSNLVRKVQLRIYIIN